MKTTPYNHVANPIIKRISIAPNGCWNWTGGVSNRGYGRVMINYRRLKAHRVFYEMFKGQIPKGKFVLHSCDNRRCCNPKHLSIGTILDNNSDAARKERKNIKLCGDDVRGIRKMGQLGYTQRAIAKQYSVSQPLVGQILLGRRRQYIE